MNDLILKSGNFIDFMNKIYHQKKVKSLSHENIKSTEMFYSNDNEFLDFFLFN